jgi:Secretion system C-terminal sorting domain
MKIKLTLLVLLFSFYLLHAQTIIPNQDGIVYVSEQGLGNKSGGSWTNAAEIRAAFIAAKTNTVIKEIWLKAGNYFPTTDHDRQKYLEIVRNLKVYGGFSGTEASVAERDLLSNISILNGDIGIPGNKADNSYHLLVIWPKNESAITDQTVVDGITFKNANANSGGVINNELPLYMGAAIFVTVQDYNQKNYPVISNCKFLDNFADQGGAAVYYDGLLSTAEQFKIKDSYFENNVSAYAGGALMFFYDEAFLEAGNTQQHYYNVEVDHCTFKQNMVNNNSQGRGAESSGGAICTFGKGNLTVRNSIFYENITDITVTAHGYATYGNGSALAAVLKSNVVVYNSLFYNNSKAAIFNREAALKIVNSTIHHPSNALISLSKAVSFEFYNSVAWNDALNVPAILLPDNQPLNALIKNSILNATPLLTLSSPALNVTSQNPLFNGTNDFTLSRKSPAVNAGEGTLFGPDLSTAKDLAGNARMRKGSIDIGAYESLYNPQPLPDANGIVYIKQNGTGNFYGNSWVNAAPELADALIAAKSNLAIKEIWVSGGIYKPLYSPEDGTNFGTDKNRDNSFLLVKDVKLYGGFAGSETILTQRNLNITANKSILSGDFGDNDQLNGSGDSFAITNNGENAYHVVVSAGDLGLAELNGFTIKGGNANANTSVLVNAQNIFRNNGGGMTNVGAASPLVANCRFEANNVYYGNGGGIFNSLASNPTITDCYFVNNTAFFVAGQGWGDEGGGAGMANLSSNPIIKRAVFSDNNTSGGRLGGAVYNELANPIFSNCLINRNVAGSGGGIFNYNSSPVLTNLNLNNNITLYNGAAVYNGGISAPIITNVTIEGNRTTYVSSFGGGLYYDANSGGSIRNSIIWNNTNAMAHAGREEIYSLNTGATKVNLLSSVVRDYHIATVDLNYTVANVITADPKFVSATDLSLQAGSPAINAGDKTLFDVGRIPDLSPNTTDLAGNPRINGIAIDLGAYEYQSTLPIQLGNFTAVMENNVAKLHWYTMSESNNKEFVLSRSADGKVFTELGRVVGHGSTNQQQNYWFDDKLPYNGINYYRLQQLDFDGKITHLGDKVLNFILAKESWSAYPNPTKDKVNIAFNDHVYTEAKLFNVTGQQLAVKTVLPNDRLVLFDLSGLPTGVYIVKLMGTGSKSIRVLKE